MTVKGSSTVLMHLASEVVKEKNKENINKKKQSLIKKKNTRNTRTRNEDRAD